MRELLGHLNFSSGRPDPGFERNFNDYFAAAGIGASADELCGQMLREIESLRGSSPAFADTHQAEAVTQLSLREVLPAYREFHADLLFHLRDEDFLQPLFLARVFEAVLSQGSPWDEPGRIVDGALAALNDFVGFRPVAVLENERLLEPYPHERFRPVPLYIRDAGVAVGRYQALIERTLQFLAEAPPELLHDAHFDLDQLDELALDVRSYDHTHPVNKRTNYTFGEWDPHNIDNRGRYRRFVLRSVILEALLKWIEGHAKGNPDEVLYDASAVLSGTMLMASSISGSGPGTHDSTVTLTSLLPRVARQRDAFYTRLLDRASGARATRLQREAKLTQQPFGHVRQFLNMELAKYGARQVQYRHLAHLYAHMGYPEASDEQATIIPSLSTRFEAEIHWRLTSAHLHLDESRVDEAAERLEQIEDLLDRGIQCGAFIDPWNILGFQGQFPLFSSREDSVPDQRAEVLLTLVEEIFDLYARALGEASVAGNEELIGDLSGRFRRLAERWDRFATSVVEDLPGVSGGEHFESASRVARLLAEWRAAGEAAGDISFWRERVDQLESARGYALVVDALLEKRDTVAAMGLLMQWLDQADQVGLESGPYSMCDMLLEWMSLVTMSTDSAQSWKTVRRLFDYLEANAGAYWSVPALTDVFGDWSPLDDDDDEIDDETSAIEEAATGDVFGADEDDDEQSLYGAAYDDMTFRDTAEDGQIDDTIDGGFGALTSEFELLTRSLEPRLRFLEALAMLWQHAAATVVAPPAVSGDEQDAPPAEVPLDDEKVEVVRGWYERTRQLQTDLISLMNSIWDYEVTAPTGDQDSNVEYDLQLQTKYFLLHGIIATYVSCWTAERCLLCCLPAGAQGESLSEDEQRIADIYRAVFRRDAIRVRRMLPRLLAQISKQPLLYVPLENGGEPEQIREARCLQAVLRFLLEQLPRLGLLHEAWHLLRTAYRMERASRPSGMAVTEFDRLFRVALQSSLDCVIRSSQTWKSGKFTEEELIDIVGEIIERYLELWLAHSETMRLSAADALGHEAIWRDVKEFVGKYGDELFHARVLTPLGNVRAILHNGVESFLDYLAESQDPLHPSKLLEDLQSGVLDRERVVNVVELIYGIVVDRFDRFLEYNTTTTQSDYGEKFFFLLDFLRIEAAYERDAWNLMPVGIAHEMLAMAGRDQAAAEWEAILRMKTADMAGEHLKELRTAESKYGMRLPSISDRLNERFVKPLAVNRMLALIPRAIDDAKNGRLPSEAFANLRTEIDTYLESTAGSSVEIAPWLRSLERAVTREVPPDEDPEVPSDAPGARLPIVPINLREMRRQLKVWGQFSTPRQRRPREG